MVRKMFVPVLCLLILSSCAGVGVLPETDIGKANYFDGGFRGLVDQYNLEAAAATSSEYKATLRIRRDYLIRAMAPIKMVSDLASKGQPISMALITQVNTALMMLKNEVVYKAVMPTKEEIARLFEQAGITRFDATAKSARNPWIIAIEIAQALFEFYQQASHQATLTPEQLAAEFQLNHAWIMGLQESDIRVVD